MNLKCIHCNTPTKKASAKRNYFNKYLIKNIKILKCTKCGEEYLGENEYEKIRLKLNKPKHKTLNLLTAKLIPTAKLMKA